MAKRAQFYWPKIVDLPSARQAALQGVVVACWTAFITTAVIIWNVYHTNDRVFDIDLSSYADVAIVLIVAFFIHRMSRIAAVVGLVYFAVNLAVTIMNDPQFRFVAVIYGLMWVNGLRGTFAYHKLQSQLSAVQPSI